MGTPVCWQHTRKEYGIKTMQSLIPNAGLGLFAIKDFYIRDWICPYVGELVSDECLTDRYGDDTAPYATDHVDGAIDSACMRGTASLANGLFTANGISRAKRFHNAQIVYNPDGIIWVRATKRINNGSEIYIHYGRQYRLEGNHTTSRIRSIDNRPC